MSGMCRVVILTVGNIFRRDDGVGCIISEKFRERGIPVIEGGEVPENYLEKVLRYDPETVLLIDAVDFNGRPGEVRIFEKDDILHQDFSTHGVSLKVSMEYLKERGVRIARLIGIQPQDRGVGRGVGRELIRSIDKVISLCMNYH